MKIAAAAMLLSLAISEPAAAQSPALWSVRDADTTIYLLGTVHLLDETDWLTGDIAEAYRQAGEVALETIITDEAATREAGLVFAASDRRLRDILPKQTRKSLEAALVSADADKSDLDGYDPWFANIIISTIAMNGSPLKGSLSVEAVLRDRAMRDSKTLTALETPEDQFSAFDSIPVDAQIRQLQLSLADPRLVRETAEQVVQCWKTGDLACAKAASDRSTGATPEARDAVLVKRNKRWADWIAERMKAPGTVLVAVGVEHFVGEGSLPDALGARALTVERIISR